MANAIARPVNLKQNIPTYLPLADAAKKFGISRKVLTQMIQTGKIEAVQLPSGELLVSADNGSNNETKERIIRDRFAHLVEESIGLREAARKYGLHTTTLYRWVRAGYINQDGSDKTLNEAEVAYCAHIYEQYRKEVGGRVVGGRIFDDDGNPYRLKHPKLARKRRSQAS